MTEYVGKIKALADPTRVRILRLIIEAGPDVCVCEIVDSLKRPFYSISKHIRELKNAGIIEETRNGKFIMYRLSRHADSFSGEILRLISSIPAELFADDSKTLRKRLAMREKGKCVLGSMSTGKNKTTERKRRGRSPHD
jgi:ArsR family transcriptional regulator